MTNDRRQILHIDMNSYFATVEQQANPSLRGKPVGVKGSHAKRTIIAAASVEAKKFGVKTGMREHEALGICPDLIVVVGEPRKYSDVTRRFIEIFGRYTDRVEIFSIDEAFLDVTSTASLFEVKRKEKKVRSGVIPRNEESPPRPIRAGQDPSYVGMTKKEENLSEDITTLFGCHSGIASRSEQYPESRNSNKLDSRLRGNDKEGEETSQGVILACPESKKKVLGIDSGQAGMTTEEGDFPGAVEIAKRIKQDIRNEIGSWISCSVGVASNKFLAKLGSDMEKPDGLVVITDENKDEILLNCKLTDFCGIAHRIERRLNDMGIFSVKQLREADDYALKKGFGIYGLKMKRMAWGRDNSEVLDWHEQEDAKSFGHSRTLNKDVTKRAEIEKHIYLLSEKIAKRMRDEEFFGKEVGLWLRFKDFSGTGKRHRVGYWVNDGNEIYKYAVKILDEIYPSSTVAQYRSSAGGDHQDCHSGLDPESRKVPNGYSSSAAERNREALGNTEGFSTRSNNKPRLPVRAIGVYVTRISKDAPLSLLPEEKKKEKMIKTMDEVNNRFGDDVLFRGTLLDIKLKEIVSGMGRKKF